MLLVLNETAWCSRWACCECSASFGSRPELTYHALDLHEAHYEDPLQCVLCHVALIDHSYQEEVVYLDDGEQFVCDLCNEVYNSKTNLSTHILTHTEINLKNELNKAASSIIDEKFFAIKDLKNEMIEVTEVTKEQDDDHLIEVTKVTKKQDEVYLKQLFLCYVCERTFHGEVDYLAHMKACVGEPIAPIVNELLALIEQNISFLCFFCERVFTCEESVQSHVSKVHGSSGNEYSISTEGGEIDIFELRCPQCNVLILNELHRDTHLCGHNAKCKFCDTLFGGLGSLWTHMLGVHNDQILTCTLCPCLVLSETDLLEHLLVKHKVIVKINCSKMRRKKLKDTSHNRKEVRENSGFVSNLSFNSMDKNQRKELREKTRMTIDGVEKFACKECPSIVNTFSSLMRHMAYAHCDETPYPCNHCSKAFKTKNKLRIHKNSVHERTRSYDCHFCGRGFAISSNLTNHLRIHTGEKPYVCDECGMKFAQSSSLYSHKITHKQDACHVCSDCGRGFLRAYQLRNHRREIHLGVLPPKSHTCDSCGAGFRTNAQLRRHQATHNPVRSFICEHCHAAFTMKKYLVQHYKTHRLSHI